MNNKLINKSQFPNKFTVQRITGIIFIFFCCLPWVNWGLNRLDSQPWPIIFGLVFLLTNYSKLIIRKVYIYSFIITIFGVVLALIINEGEINKTNVRGIANYLGFYVILFGFGTFLSKFGFPIKTIIAVNIAWLVSAVLEIAFPGILNSIVLERTTVGRGVTSLSPEATYFGMYLFFNSWLILRERNYQPSLKLSCLILVNILGILILAKSSMVILYCIVSAIAIGFYHFAKIKFTKKTFKFFILLLILFIFSFYMIFFQMEDSRLFKLLTWTLSEGLLQTFYLDASMNARLSNVIFPIEGFLMSYGVPGGFESFGDSLILINKDYNGFFWFVYDNDKIMSWIGSFIYELGVFGLIAISLLFFKLKISHLIRVELTLLFVLLFSAIPLAFPLIAMLLALISDKRLNSIR